VTVLTSNPVWHVRGGRRTVLLKGHGLTLLASGDTLLIYTGATDGTPDGPDSLGTLRWTFLGSAHTAEA